MEEQDIGEYGVVHHSRSIWWEDDEEGAMPQMMVEGDGQSEQEQNYSEGTGMLQLANPNRQWVFHISHGG